MGAPHYWTDPCGWEGKWDYAVFVMLVIHIFYFLYAHLTQSGAWFYQRIWWVREVLYTGTDNKISQIQNFRSKLMILVILKSLGGLAAVPMSQMALAQKAESARLRPLVPFACMVLSILSFMYVTISMFYMHFYSLAAQKVGDKDVIPRHSTLNSHEPSHGDPLSRTNSVALQLQSEKGATILKEGEHKITSSKKTETTTTTAGGASSKTLVVPPTPSSNGGKVKWQPHIAGTIASLATDAAKAYSIGWHFIRMGFAFLLWPFSPLVCFVCSILMLVMISQGTMNKFNKRSLSLNYFAHSPFYADILVQKGYCTLPSPPSLEGGAGAGGRTTTEQQQQQQQQQRNSLDTADAVSSRSPGSSATLDSARPMVLPVPGARGTVGRGASKESAQVPE